MGDEGCVKSHLMEYTFFMIVACLTQHTYSMCRLYGLFTMETILATAFGRVINLQCGEANQLTEAAAAMFGAAQEDQSLSVDAVMVILS